MNRPIRRVALFVIGMVVLLLAYSTYFLVFRADDLRTDSRNTRTLLDQWGRERGIIATSDGTVIAKSVPVDTEFEYQRVYPDDPEVFAPVTGYYSFTLGRDRGIEFAEDAFLSGDDNRLWTQQFGDMFAGREPRGGNVITTIDADLQRAAFSALRDGNCVGACRGAVVALEPHTGKILAMVSTPTYDPNLLAATDNSAQAAWNDLHPDSPNSPLLNRAIDIRKPPGSTFKVVTTSAALQDGLDANVQLTGAATINFPDGQPLSNDSNSTCGNSGGGQVSLATALEYSCNTAFADLVVDKMNNGAEALEKTAHAYGIGETPPRIPMLVATSEFGDLQGSKALLGQSSIGQYNVQLTVLQNAMIAGTVANGGIMMRPSTVERLETADLKLVAPYSAKQLSKPIDPHQAQVITDMMRAAERRNSEGQSGIASKTGTAQQGEGAGQTLAWYIAFSTDSDRKIAVAVLVENGVGGDVAYGGRIAAPIGRKVINTYTGGP